MPDGLYSKPGKAFRNEISPRSGLLRVREFEMAEIEHFVHPEKRNKFEKFSSVADISISFFSACNQMEGKSAENLTLGEAVQRVSNYCFIIKQSLDEFRMCLKFHLIFSCMSGNVL